MVKFPSISIFCRIFVGKFISKRSLSVATLPSAIPFPFSRKSITVYAVERLCEYSAKLKKSVGDSIKKYKIKREIAFEILYNRHKRRKLLCQVNHPKHTKQFKLDAINYRKEHPNLTQAKVAENLGIGLSTLIR